MSRNDSIDTFFISFISYVREENKYNFMQNIARNLKNVFFVRIVGSFAQVPVNYQSNFAKKCLENGLVNYRERVLDFGVARCQGVLVFKLKSCPIN